MMIFLKKIFYIILIIFILCLNGCHQDINLSNPGGVSPSSTLNNIEEHGYVLIKGNPTIIKDCTPELSISAGGKEVVFMAFSGNGNEWSEWFEYSESYDEFNIASGQDGTSRDSGFKTLYIRFKDSKGTIIPEHYQEPIFCIFEYKIQELFSICIEPDEVQIKIRESQDFTVKGYDLFSENEVPLDGKKVKWSKPCDIGKLEPTEGLQTTYIAPLYSGKRNITVQYGSLSAGAKI
ncbi:MAG: hypothetical protein R6V04_03440 [bacterium]